MFIAKVVGVSVEGQLLDEKQKLHLEQAGLIHYSHGDYITQGRTLGNFGYSIRKKPAARKNSKKAGYSGYRKKK